MLRQCTFRYQSIQRELQVDVAEPMANVARIAAASFTNALDKRREKVISRIKKNNSKAAAAITRIPPSAHYMFGGDHSQLAKVVELTKDLSSTANKPSINTPTNKSKYKGGNGGGASHSRGGHNGGGRGHGGRGGGAGNGAGSGKRRKSEAEKSSDSFRGGNSSRGERTKFLPRTSKDYFKPHPVPQCWPWAMDTISDSSPAGKVYSRRTDEALERLASRDR